MEALLKESSDKLTAALELLFASVDGYPGFDPCLKSFRTFERVREVAVSLKPRLSGCINVDTFGQ